MAEKDDRRTMSAASMAMSEPDPRAMPMSAALRDGASFTPSPVMPTISSLAWNSRTMRSFCSDITRLVHRVIIKFGENECTWGGTGEYDFIVCAE